MFDPASIAGPGWSQAGELPPFDPAVSPPRTDAQLDFLTEDIVTFRADDGRSVIDVGWYPHRDAKGAFRSVFIRDNDWQHPEDYVVHKSLAAVRSWIDFKMSQQSSTSGSRSRIGSARPSTDQKKSSPKRQPARAPASSSDRWEQVSDSPLERPRLSYAGLGA